MKNINKNKTEFNSLEFERLIQEERKTNPDYFKAEVIDNGDHLNKENIQYCENYINDGFY